MDSENLSIGILRMDTPELPVPVKTVQPRIYFNSKGRHQALYDRLFDQLVADADEIDSEAGRLLAFVSNVYHHVHANKVMDVHPTDEWFATLVKERRDGLPVDLLEADTHPALSEVWRGCITPDTLEDAIDEAVKIARKHVERLSRAEIRQAQRSEEEKSAGRGNGKRKHSSNSVESKKKQRRDEMLQEIRDSVRDLNPEGIKSNMRRSKLRKLRVTHNELSELLDGLVESSDDLNEDDLCETIAFLHQEGLLGISHSFSLDVWEAWIAKYPSLVEIKDRLRFV